ncbi:hypothetical protein GCM10010198_06920 [Nocardia seriolae]|nr:hypothetical protein NSERKGN1266_18930 [Nocardia seriolae]BEK98120.1 hypothetical protein NSER024013_60260 [Nocardia seriolae]
MRDKAQLGPGGELVVDGSGLGTTRADADRAWARALGEGTGPADVVHAILGDGTIVTYRR